MERHFFDVTGDNDFIDRQGSEFANLAGARNEAIRYACDLLANEQARIVDGKEWKMVVSDHNRTDMFTLKFILQHASDNVLRMPTGLGTV